MYSQCNHSLHVTGVLKLFQFMEIKNIVEIVEIALSVRLSLGSWAVLSLGVSLVYMYSTLFQQNGIETLYMEFRINFICYAKE